MAEIVNAHLCLGLLLYDLVTCHCLQNMVAKTKRLRLMVRGDGIIVGASADNAWALHVLGVDPTKIIHQSMAQYVDVFADVGRALPAGRLTPTLVTGDQLYIRLSALSCISVQQTLTLLPCCNCTG